MIIEKRVCADCGRVINYGDGEDLCYWTYTRPMYDPNQIYGDAICEECLIKRYKKKDPNAVITIIGR